MDDVTLVQKLKCNDRQAFEILFDRLFHHVRFYAERIVRDNIEAEDIAMVSMSKYWEKAATIDSLDHVRCFLLKVTRHLCIDHLRRAKVRENNYKQYQNSLPTEHEMDGFEYEAFMFEEQFNQVLEEVERLPGQTKNVVKLVYLERVPREDVASRLAISIGTVHVQCSRGVARLKTIFGSKETALFFLLFPGALKQLANFLPF